MFTVCQKTDTKETDHVDVTVKDRSHMSMHNPDHVTTAEDDHHIEVDRLITTDLMTEVDQVTEDTPVTMDVIVEVIAETEVIVDHSIMVTNGTSMTTREVPVGIVIVGAGTKIVTGTVVGIDTVVTVGTTMSHDGPTAMTVDTIEVVVGTINQEIKGM